MSKQPRCGRQWRDREIKRVRRERGVSHTAAMRIVDAERAAAGTPMPAWVRPKGLRVWDERWSEESTPFTPPPGIPPLEDPYGHAYDSASAGYLLTFTVPDGEDSAGCTEVEKTIRAIVYAHRFLVIPDRGWLRAAAGVFGPLQLPAPNSSEAETPEGYVTATVMVQPFARLAPGLDALKAFMDASRDAVTTVLLAKYPVPMAGLAPVARTVEAEMLQSISERLTPQTLSWMYLHPTLAGHGPAYETYPDRVVDIRCRGWRHTGHGRYTVDFQEERGLPERTYDELAAIDGPLSLVEPPWEGNADDFFESLVEAGDRAAGSLLVALHRLDTHYREWSAKSGGPTLSLTAGQEEAWATMTMMDLVREQGAALAAQPNRYSESVVTKLYEELEGWTGTQQAYTEVAHNLGVLFTRAAATAGGWTALADEGLRSLSLAENWLMQRSPRAEADARAAAAGAGPPGDGFGGHEFEYEQATDLFRCSECRVYEVAARDTDGPITVCPGLEGYGGDTERVYLLLTENPELHRGYGTALARIIRGTGIGRSPRFSWREGKLLVESAPSVVADLAHRIEETTFTVNGSQVPAVASVEHLTAEAGRAVIAANYQAYVAEYGEPAINR